MKYQLINLKDKFVGLKQSNTSIYLNTTTQKSLILDEKMYEILKDQIKFQLDSGNLEMRKLQDCQVPKENKQEDQKPAEQDQKPKKKAFKKEEAAPAEESKEENK